jgi:hypothetical protein
MRLRLLSLHEEWRRFWFEPSTSFNLAFCRVLFFGLMFLYYLDTDFSAWAEIDKFFLKPIWLFRQFHLPLLTKDQLEIVQIAWKAALGLSCIGLLTRPSTVVSFALGIYLLAVRHNFGKVSHEDAVLVFVLGIMALSRCGDGLSIDRLFSRPRTSGVPQPIPPILSGEYTWPVRAVWLVTALIFFAAGVSKIMKTGMEWVISDNMTILLLQFDYRNSPLTSWGFYIARYGWICQILSAATIVFETGFPLALFSRRARWVIVPAMASIQLWIQILMGIYFTQFMIVYVFWIPWDRVNWVIRTVGAAGIIFFIRPDWVNRTARLAGIEHNMELPIYLGLSAFAFTCLIYYALAGMRKQQGQT